MFVFRGIRKSRSNCMITSSSASLRKEVSLAVLFSVICLLFTVCHVPRIFVAVDIFLRTESYVG